MATQNNLRIPEDLFIQAQRLADTQGRTTDALAVDALRLYLETQQNVRALDELATWGEGHARAHGFKLSDVERAISEVRRARQ